MSFGLILGQVLSLESVDKTNLLTKTPTIPAVNTMTASTVRIPVQAQESEENNKLYLAVSLFQTTTWELIHLSDL